MVGKNFKPLAHIFFVHEHCVYIFAKPHQAREFCNQKTNSRYLCNSNIVTRHIDGTRIQLLGPMLGTLHLGRFCTYGGCTQRCHCTIYSNYNRNILHIHLFINTRCKPSISVGYRMINTFVDKIIIRFLFKQLSRCIRQ